MKGDMKDGFTRTEDRFNRLDRWVMLLIGAFIPKGGFDTVNSAGKFGMKAKENSNSTSKP
ncbi:hypothetical protein L873DRAFT_1798993 [Choiromyces venosus 120613-1]|uniref:Uncharacterized protein n=1 Tax=Choiromyces venosus 120613-1 TaxID=1336337 RepID=A0A3N4K1Z5_9PEZI|nr:hypothetical protein L873DRAFT_1798993 [Choiromyces venosus 120613-1]